MKAVLISIRPQYCELIASGKKTIEVRKTRPKIETPFKCYIYCTQSGKYVEGKQVKNIWVNRGTDNRYIGNGKVIGEFVCDRIVEIGYSPYNHGEYVCEVENIHDASCVDFSTMYCYIEEGYGYGWHISDLKIYDKPRELREFFHACDTGDKVVCDNCDHRFDRVCNGRKYVKRTPQSWCYVEEV